MNLAQGFVGGESVAEGHWFEGVVGWPMLFPPLLPVGESETGGKPGRSFGTTGGFSGFKGLSLTGGNPGRGVVF